jgi:hypothetical protein
MCRRLTKFRIYGKFHSGNLNGIRDHLGDDNISAKLILKCVSQKPGARIWMNSAGSG